MWPRTGTQNGHPVRRAARQELAETHFPRGHPFQSEEAAWRAKDSRHVEGSRAGPPIPVLPPGKSCGGHRLEAGEPGEGLGGAVPRGQAWKGAARSRVSLKCSESARRNVEDVGL